jgi:hypothetical protein
MKGAGKYLKYAIFGIIGFYAVTSMGLLKKLPISPTMLIVILGIGVGFWFWQKRKKQGGGDKF